MPNTGSAAAKNRVRGSLCLARQTPRGSTWRQQWASAARVTLSKPSQRRATRIRRMEEEEEERRMVTALSLSPPEGSAPGGWIMSDSWKADPTEMS